MKAKKSAPVWAALAPSLIEAIRLPRYLGGSNASWPFFGLAARSRFETRGRAYRFTARRASLPTFHNHKLRSEGAPTSLPVRKPPLKSALRELRLSSRSREILCRSPARRLAGQPARRPRAAAASSHYRCVSKVPAVLLLFASYGDFGERTFPLFRLHLFPRVGGGTVL